MLKRMHTNIPDNAGDSAKASFGISGNASIIFRSVLNFAAIGVMQWYAAEKVKKLWSDFLILHGPMLFNPSSFSLEINFPCYE